MLRSLILIQCVFLLAVAVKVPLRSKSSRKSPSPHLPRRLVQRDAVDKNVTLDDQQDRIYTVDITVAGTSYEAQVDSGSSDLWISTSLNNLKTLNTTSIQANVTYGVGFAAGTIAVGPVEFSGITVPRQAFLAATNVDNPITSLNADALVGTGFTRLSEIDATINATGDSYGRSLLFNIFSQNPSTANYMAVTLQRDGDSENDVVGSISISEIDPEFAGILNTPRILTFPPTDPLRWTTIIDSILVNGSTISPGSSVVSGAPTGKMIGLLDSGTSYVYASQAIVTRIYGSIPGASFSQPLGTWICPCDAEIDVSITIGGRNFNIHPLDMSIPTLTDNSTCQGTWIPASFQDSTYDILLGVAMLRSVVALYNYGDFKDDMSLDDPFLQLFSLVTNGTQAGNEFRAIRGGAIAANSFPNNAGVNAPSTSSTPSSPQGQSPDLLSLQTKVDRIYSFAPALFALAALNVIVLLVVLGGFCLRIARRRKRKSNKSKSRSPKSGPGSEEQDAFDSEGASGSFIPLSRPNASASQNQYRPVSMGSTLRDSRLYDAPKSPGHEKSFNYDSVKSMDDEEALPLPRPRAPALRNSYRPLSSGSTLRDSRLYDIPKSPGYDKSFSFDAARASGYDQNFSPSSMSPTSAVETHPSAVMFHEPLISIQESSSPDIVETSSVENLPRQHDQSSVYTQDITAQVSINDPVPVESFDHSAPAATSAG